MTTQTIAKVMALAMLVAGCVASPANDVRARLGASSEAVAYGISAYELGDGGASLYSSTGALLGSITIEPGSTAGPRIHLDLVDGTYWDTEFETHSDIGYPMSLENDNVMTAVELDPALAPLWATVGIRYSPSNPAVVQSEAVATTDSYEVCILPPNPVCRALGCSLNYDIPFFERIGSTHLDRCTPRACESWCGDNFAYGGPVEATCDGPFGRCDCYSHKLKTTRHASCPRISCENTSDCDLVDLVRDCIDPGPSCSNTGTGYSGCTDRVDSNRDCGWRR